MLQVISQATMPGDSVTNHPMEASSTHDHMPEATLASSPSSGTPGSRFDPKRYRQAQALRVEELWDWSRKQQTVIPVRKPSKKQFVRTHSSPDYRADSMPTIVDDATGEVYLLAADFDLPADIENKVDMVNMAAAITADGSIFLWFYKNSTNSWSESARIAIREASLRWVRVLPDKSSNGYLLEAPMVAPADPVWPPMTFTEILETAFGARYIDSLQHPQIKKLRGDFNA
jgi:hypothetical protein